MVRARVSARVWFRVKARVSARVWVRVKARVRVRATLTVSSKVYDSLSRKQEVPLEPNYGRTPQLQLSLLLAAC